ncbi:MAG: hypothetical protein HFG27_11825 [Provencibacterium sp.]|jgi:hypothetical protein|nr:hypothetical protein [Provencibacterium sp.]
MFQAIKTVMGELFQNRYRLLPCFYLQIPVGHMETGLCTYNLYFSLSGGV